MSSNPGLALLAPLLTAQLDSIAVVLKDTAARLEAIKAAAAQAAERETALTEQPAERASEHESDDPDRIVTLAEASRLSSLSIDTLRRKHRNKLVQLGERRLGMRRRDALMLSG